MSDVSAGISVGILSVIAATATFGAVQLASGHDLTNSLRSFSAAPREASIAAPAFTLAPQEDVNRAAKSNRVANVALSHAPTQTISIHIDRIADTSVLVRIPSRQEARNTSPARTPGLIKSEDQKAAVACEPTVSILTEIAKRLQPGRCLT
jgi:hypothetical protein